MSPTLNAPRPSAPGSVADTHGPVYLQYRSFALKRATEELVDETAREFYDKPCKPVFGACCARDQADGGMSIICG